MTYSDRDGSEPMHELGHFQGFGHRIPDARTVMAPAGPPLHEQADRDGDNLPSDRVRAYAEALATAVGDGAADDWLIHARGLVAVADREQVALLATINELHASVIEMGEYNRQAEATIARVEALADEDTHHLRSGVVGMVRLSDLAAALRGPAPTEEPS